ncbi:poly A polymerase CID/PAP-related protein [Babesia gibsoni]|uniref:Poly A polymerase CID/PAP-related protein n=1 Tax=Babesia gibsoni TaxID=33632 RepID=A0AAD8LQV6_BABGI|nr:poly A polymerase CID/PAP-related protein [Babesia gibsoni]
MYVLPFLVRQLESCQHFTRLPNGGLSRKAFPPEAWRTRRESYNGFSSTSTSQSQENLHSPSSVTPPKVSPGHSSHSFLSYGASREIKERGTVQNYGCNGPLSCRGPLNTNTLGVLHHCPRQHYTVASPNSETDAPERTKELCDILLELHSIFGQEFSAADKLELLSMCHNNGRHRHPEFSVLMLELWQNTGRLKQHEISVYHKICKEISSDNWLAVTQRPTCEPFKLYERQFLYDLNRLNNLILTPTLEQYRKKRDLINSLKPTLEKATQGILHTFGSCENGLWVRGSDVDMCLEITNCNSKRNWLSKLHLIRSALSSNEMISNITIISAKVPIAKLYNKDNHNFCDISINNTVALDNTSFVKAMVKIDFRVVKLARFIKYWATHRCINNRAQGTLSSYALILQLFHFLQNRSPPILPLYKDIEREACDGNKGQSSRFITDTNEILERCEYLGKNKESLTQLLFDFFNFYSDKRFQGGRCGATIDIYTNEVSENNLGVLVMKCPITGKNVNPFTITMWQSIYREFKRVDTYIKEQRPIPQICMRVSVPPLEAEAEIKRQHAHMIRRMMMMNVKVSRSPATKTLNRK